MAHVRHQNARPRTSRARPGTWDVRGRARDVRFGRWTCAIYSMVTHFGPAIFIRFSKYALEYDVYMFTAPMLKYFKVQSLVKKVIIPRKSNFQVNVEATLNCFSAQKTPSLSRIRIFYRLIRPNLCRNAPICVFLAHVPTARDVRFRFFADFQKSILHIFSKADITKSVHII